MHMSALAKNNLRCMALNFLQPVHLIPFDVNEQRVAVVQLTENKRTHRLSSGLRRQEMADRANSSDLEKCRTTDVVNMLHHRQSCVSVDPEIFDTAFEGSVIIANSQVVFTHSAQGTLLSRVDTTSYSRQHYYYVAFCTKVWKSFKVFLNFGKLTLSFDFLSSVSLRL